MHVPDFVVNGVISFVVRRIHAFGDSIDWEVVKLHAIERINHILPSFLEEPIDVIVSGLVDLAKTILTSDGFLIKMAHFLTEQNFVGIIEAFKDLMWDFVKGRLSPTNVSLLSDVGELSKELGLFNHFKSNVVAV